MDEGEGPEPLRQRALKLLSRLHRQWPSVTSERLQQTPGSGYILPFLEESHTETPFVLRGKVAQALETAEVTQIPQYTGLLDATKQLRPF